MELAGLDIDAGHHAIDFAVSGDETGRPNTLPGYGTVGQSSLAAGAASIAPRSAEKVRSSSGAGQDVRPDAVLVTSYTE